MKEEKRAFIFLVIAIALATVYGVSIVKVGPFDKCEYYQRNFDYFFGNYNISMNHHLLAAKGFIEKFSENNSSLPFGAYYEGLNYIDEFYRDAFVVMTTKMFTRVTTLMQNYTAPEIYHTSYNNSDQTDHPLNCIENLYDIFIVAVSSRDNLTKFVNEAMHSYIERQNEPK